MWLSNNKQSFTVLQSSYYINLHDSYNQIIFETIFFNVLCIPRYLYCLFSIFKTEIHDSLCHSGMCE